MAAVIAIRPGIVVQHNKRTAIIKSLPTTDAARIRVLETNEEITVPISELDTTSERAPPLRELPGISEGEWEVAVERYKIIQPLLTRDRTAKQVEQAAQATGIHYTTLYRWISKFESTGVVSSLVRKRRKDAGISRLDPEVQKLVKEVLEKELLTRRKNSITRAHKVLDNKIVKAKLGEKVPHRNTLRRQYIAIAPEVRDLKRGGIEAARKYQPLRGTVPNADYPYSVIQVDHTRADVFLVDVVHRLPIGRPWITVAIDVFSRMVAGWYVSFDPPGTLGTGLCIANAILNKEKILAQLDANFDYPCEGLPTYLHMDNAREFRGNALKMACDEYGINLSFRKVKKPNYGGHIERLLGTLLQEMHAVPGTTFSNIEAKGDFDPAADAALTLEEFEAWLANLILGMYHNRVHSTLGTTPLAKYKQGILGTDEAPGPGILRVSDPDRLRIYFLPMDTRTVQPDGITLFNIIYYSDVLRHWIGALEPGKLSQKRKFLVRWDPRDISAIWFFDPDLEKHSRISYRNITHPAISLWELRSVQRYLDAQGKKNQDEATIFLAFDEMLRIEDEATKKTRKTRLAQERRARHKATSYIEGCANKPNDLDPEKPPPPLSREIVPFDEIEEI